MEFQQVCQLRSATKTCAHGKAPNLRGGVCGACRAGSEDLVRCDFGAAHEETRHFYTFLIISGSFVFLHYLAWFFRSVFGARNFAWVQKLRNYSPNEELDIVWHCHILDTRNYADFQQQLGTIGHMPFGDEETNDLAQYLGCFSYVSQFYHSLYIYIYISSFVFHVLIIFLSFLSVRSIYSSELRLECMLLLSCLEGFTMLVVVVSFFSSIWFSRTESVLNAVSMFSDTKLLNTFFSTGRIKCERL